MEKSSKFILSFLIIFFFFSFFQSSQAGFFDWFKWFRKRDSPKNTETTLNSRQNILYTLSVSKLGSGVVTSDDRKINCGKQCQASYPADSKIVLKAEADNNYKLDRWNGCNTISGGECQTTLNKSKIIVAKFSLKTLSYSQKISSSSASKTSSSKSSSSSSKNPIFSQKSLSSSVVKTSSSKSSSTSSNRSVQTEKLIVQKCTDGTLYNQCSSNKPKYCDSGNLVDNCQSCKCSLDMTCNTESKKCLTPITVGNYYDVCWDYDCSSKYPPYPKLIESLKPSAINKCKECYLRGNEEVNIIIVFLYAYDPLPDEYINILQGSENDVRSFKYAAKWYREQVGKYNINLNVDINFSESQLKVPVEYIIHTYEESFNKNLTKYVKETLPQINDYDVIVPFYYGSYDFSFANHVTSKNSFEIFSKQYSLGFFYPEFTEGSTSYSKTFAHELTHLFGATDKYTCLDTSSESCLYANENGIGCWIESEDLNQLGKDIMCHRMPKYDGQWAFINLPLNELVVIDATAREIGWYDADRDGIVEVDDLCPFNQLNDCILNTFQF